LTEVAMVTLYYIKISAYYFAMSDDTKEFWFELKLIKRVQKLKKTDVWEVS